MLVIGLVVAVRGSLGIAKAAFRLDGGDPASRDDCVE